MTMTDDILEAYKTYLKERKEGESIYQYVDRKRNELADALRAKQERESKFWNLKPEDFEDLEPVEESDNRYNEPKSAPKTSKEYASQIIEANDIYREVRDRMMEAQIKQVSYGLDKYPEPLNADSWDVIETLDHIIDETVDKLHYLVMLKTKLIKEQENK